MFQQTTLDQTNDIAQGDTIRALHDNDAARADTYVQGT